jgi:hypothetical protein
VFGWVASWVGEDASAADPVIGVIVDMAVDPGCSHPNAAKIGHPGEGVQFGEDVVAVKVEIGFRGLRRGR